MSHNASYVSNRHIKGDQTSTATRHLLASTSNSHRQPPPTTTTTTAYRERSKSRSSSTATNNDYMRTMSNNIAAATRPPPPHYRPSPTNNINSSSSSSSNNRDRYNYSTNYGKSSLPPILNQPPSIDTRYSTTNNSYKAPLPATITATLTMSPQSSKHAQQQQAIDNVTNHLNNLDLKSYQQQSSKYYTTNEDDDEPYPDQQSRKNSDDNHYSNNNSSNYDDDSMYRANLENNGLVGLKNLGNTCFMNSIIQSLNNSKLLIQYCLKESIYENDLNTTLSTMKGSLFLSYANLVRSMWSPKYANSCISPVEFKGRIAQFAPRFLGYAQQDAQEFLRYLLSGLHEDVNLVKARPKPINYDEKEEDRMSETEKSELYWKRYLRIDRSKIVDIFVGQLKSTLTCTVCDYKSVTFDPFWDLSLPIPRKGFYTTTVSLGDCIKLFMAEEILDGDEKPTCSNCKKKQRCKKSFSIQRLPENLVLHLKRFSPNSHRKLTTNVEYPIEDLDMEPYISETIRTLSSTITKYDLYSISLHSGTAFSGHYIAYSKHPYTKKWHCFNDSSVSQVSTRTLQNSDAYVLFYEKRK